jgi:uncharacterized membrane protein YheB (UPF0754 family)
VDVPDGLLWALVMIIFGALAGGLTNTVAIWMLFHPYEPPRLGPIRLRWFQGAVPKNQDRLAAAIGRTVGNRLLTPEDLARILAEGEFRHAFDERLAAFLNEVLHRERGTLREVVPPSVLPQVEELLDALVDHSLGRLGDYLSSERFALSVEQRAAELVAAVADEPVAALLTPDREAVVTEAVQAWLASAVDSPDFRQAVDDYLLRASDNLLRPDRTFEEILPLGLVGSLEHAIGGYLPLAIERLGSLLEDPSARARFESTLHDLFRRFLGDLKFHQRVVARMVVTDDTLDRILDTIEREGAERLSEILREPAVQTAMARGVNEAIVEFLRRPVRSVLGEPDSAAVVEARSTLSGWIVNMARDPQTQEFLVDKLHSGLERAGARTWGDILSRVPPERVAGWFVSVARSEGAARLYREVARRAADGLLRNPIGRPSRWLPDDASRRLEERVGPMLWEWLQGQVPDLVHRLDVARRVEVKVMEFPTARMEELVRRVTDRELRLIVRLGYVLGAVVGVVLVGIDALMR